jgi:hypothetical protein
MQDVWLLLETQNPHFVIHFCTNHYRPFEEGEKTRLERELRNYTFVRPEYHLMADLVERVTHKGKITVNGRIKAVDRNLFEKPGGDIRALIVEVDARDLIRLVSDD